jgi:hypothetical protein
MLIYERFNVVACPKLLALTPLRLQYKDLQVQLRPTG